MDLILACLLLLFWLQPVCGSSTLVPWIYVLSSFTYLNWLVITDQSTMMLAKSSQRLIIPWGILIWKGKWSVNLLTSWGVCWVELVTCVDSKLQFQASYLLESTSSSWPLERYLVYLSFVFPECCLYFSVWYCHFSLVGGLMKQV